ncbi:MAG: M56 family metallopeptidase [Bacillota bacterium]|nr:M56 family metallopeptidase [Bacillota bacterium]
MAYRRLASWGTFALVQLVVLLLASAVYEVEIRSLIPKGGVCPTCSLVLPQLLFLALVTALGASSAVTLLGVALGVRRVRALRRGLVERIGLDGGGTGLAVRLDRLARDGRLLPQERSVLHVLARPTTPEAFTLGLLRPGVFLSPSLARLDDEPLLAVLRHELDHVRHRDPLHRLLEAVLQRSFPYVPLLGYAAGRLEELRETAADEAALAAGSRPSDLLEALAALIETPGAPPQAAAAEAEALVSPFAARRRPARPVSARENLRLWHLIEAGQGRAGRHLPVHWLSNSAGLLLASLLAFLPLAAVLLIRCTTFAAWIG